MKKFVLCLSVVVWVLMPACVLGGIIIEDTFFTYQPDSGSGVVTVHSWVEEFPATQLYRYHYRILDPAINIQWFSVELMPDVIITDYATYSGGVGEPAVWLENGLGTSFDATFTNPILSPTGDSVVLWFVSPQGPTTQNGMAAGISAGEYSAFYGDLYTPIPEPVTMVLLASGAFFALRRRHN